MLLDRGKIKRELIRMMEGWRHSGLNVYAGPRIHPRQKRSLENLAAYLICSSFSQQRMEYRPEETKVTYLSKDRKEKKSYDATEWLAAMGSHVPERGQQSVRYYGTYANSTLDTDCEMALIRVPVSAPVCPKTAFPAFSSDSTGDRTPRPGQCLLLLLSHSQPATTYGTSFSLQASCYRLNSGRAQTRPVVIS